MGAVHGLEWLLMAESPSIQRLHKAVSGRGRSDGVPATPTDLILASDFGLL